MQHGQKTNGLTLDNSQWFTSITLPGKKTAVHRAGKLGDMMNRILQSRNVHTYTDHSLK